MIGQAGMDRFHVYFQHCCLLERCMTENDVNTLLCSCSVISNTDSCTFWFSGTKPHPVCAQPKLEITHRVCTSAKIERNSQNLVVLMIENA